MNSSNLISLIVGIIFAVAVVLYILMWRKKMKDKQELPNLLESIDNAIQEQNLSESNDLGLKLVYNRSVQKKHLDDLSEKLNATFGEQEELTALRKAIYNKQMHWKREAPY